MASIVQQKRGEVTKGLRDKAQIEIRRFRDEASGRAGDAQERAKAQKMRDKQMEEHDEEDGCGREEVASASPANLCEKLSWPLAKGALLVTYNSITYSGTPWFDHDRFHPFAPKKLARLKPIGGVRFATAEAGIRYKGPHGVTCWPWLDEGTTVAGVLTQSKTASAPVLLCRKHLKKGSARILVVNSGNANAFTG